MSECSREAAKLKLFTRLGLFLVVTSTLALVCVFVGPRVIARCGFSPWTWRMLEEWDMAEERLNMLPDLTQNHLKMGMHRSEVEELLGNHEPYYLGYSGYGPGTRFLHIVYGSDDCVVRWYQAN